MLTKNKSRARQIKNNIASLKDKGYPQIHRMNLSEGLDPRSRTALGKTGIEVSPLGFGASPLGSIFGKIDVRSPCFNPLPVLVLKILLASSLVELYLIHKW